ncbi:NADP-dependent oxidoreductase [Dactylosporangium matsuzakiense]|uniref:Oxidoreductase n=1 Tax=Dactylosporangium matsuzakiense TaxID=53360 RepID=A0A9W6NQ19_9ACTN|nr:NADP-dependent oxidoreductase [Dactylosporangium matsuzakiense]UWZ40982.1 NADP-dependent oxidoreductase [Dactylosporangium matsuzakiense]GLL04811.1 putative oxidoreductase [Dactylosporangium matsuzakiense]
MAVQWVAPSFGGPEVLTLVDTEVPPPGAGEVTIDVRAAGVNPADYKHLSPDRGTDRELPLRIGYEVAGVLSAVGPGTEIASGGGSVGDAVLAFRIAGGYSSRVTVPAKDVFAKPGSLDFPAAANLLLAGTTAAEALHVVGAAAGETILVHGASGAVGISVLQQARLKGIAVVGTASERNFGLLRRTGAEPIPYGPGLRSRIPPGIAAVIDTVGTDEALDTIDNPARAVTIVASERSRAAGIRAIAGNLPQSAAYRDSVRARLIAWADEGRLVVPVARTFPLTEAPAAIDLVRTGHPGGKVALIP